MDGMSTDRIPDVRYPGGWNVGGQNSGYEISGWNEGEFPQWVVVQAVQGGSRRLHNHQGKNCRASLLKGLLQP